MHARIFERPANWNAQRYERVYHDGLFKDMLYEEFEEYDEAKTLYDKLDGLADIFFITVGALWKLGEDPYIYLHKSYPEAFNYPATPKYNNGELKRIVNVILDLDQLDQLKIALSYLIEALWEEFSNLGCEEEEAILAIEIICDSNDTKELIALDKHDKGILKANRFKPPTKRLQLLVESIQDEEI